MVYNGSVEAFSLQINTTRNLMEQGRYRKAFELIVNQEVQSLTELLEKIECLVDIGIMLRDEKILRYSLYLLETHSREVEEVRDLAPFYFLNLAHQYANMVSLSSFEPESYGFFKRAEQVKARFFYEKVLAFEALPPRTAFEAWAGLGKMYQSTGRGLEALQAYQQALKIYPDSREILQDKVRLMAEYALPALPNRREFLQEAMTLLKKSSALRAGEDEQEELLLKSRLAQAGLTREELEAEGEYPVNTFPVSGEEEMRFRRFCLDSRLYVNVCGFCRKCEFSIGDHFSLSSSGLTIHPGQTKRFVTLRRLYAVMMGIYTAGRSDLAEALAVCHEPVYWNKSFFSLGNRQEFPLKKPAFFRLVSSYLAAWKLWDHGAVFLALYWGHGKASSMETLFFKHPGGEAAGTGEEVKAFWLNKTSPSLHAVFDLYMDCTRGRDQDLALLANKLSQPDFLDFPSFEGLAEKCTRLYAKASLLLQYLGIMHERREISGGKWEFSHPLYNFAGIQQDYKNKGLYNE